MSSFSAITNTYNSSTSFKQNEFHHAVLSISGTIHTLYLDGIQVAQNTNAVNIFDVYSTITNTTIGCLTDKTQAFCGFIDDFKVYNKAISSSAVSNLYLNRNLVVYYPFDVSVNNLTPNNALLTYDASFVGNAGITTNSLIGTGALFLTNTAGANATSYIASSPGIPIPLNSSTGLTISCWVNTLSLTNTSTMCLFDIPYISGYKGISVDICGNNTIYSTAFSPIPPVPSNLSLTGKSYSTASISFSIEKNLPLSYSIILSPSENTIVTINNTDIYMSMLKPGGTQYSIYIIATNSYKSSTSSTLTFTTLYALLYYQFNINPNITTEYISQSQTGGTSIEPDGTRGTGTGDKMSYMSIRFKASGNMTLPSFTITNNQLSVSFWIYPVTNQGSIPIFCLAPTNSSTTFKNGRLQVWYNSGIKIYLNNSTDNTNLINTNPVTGTYLSSFWNYHCFVIDATSLRYYYNSNLNTTYNLSGYTLPNQTYTYNVLGSEPYIGDLPNNCFNLSSFRVYNKALTTSEINTLYNTPYTVDI